MLFYFLVLKGAEMSKKTDPVVTAYLHEVKQTTYEKWLDDAFWQYFRAACTNKKSAEYKHINTFLKNKLHNEAYLQVEIGDISFTKINDK